MGKITCDVIIDLLPLYVEGEASADSKVLVEEHLSGCSLCSEKLKELKAPLLIPPETEQNVMQIIRKKQRRRIARNIALVILIFLLLAGLPIFSVYVDMSVHLDASDITVETTESGQTRLKLSDRAEGGILYFIYTQDGDGNTTVYFSVSNTPRLIKLAGRILDLKLFDEDFYTQDFPLDIYNVSWEITDGRVTEMQMSGYYSIGFCGSVILGDSISAVYYQPDIDSEVAAFGAYMDSLMNAACNTVFGSETQWSGEELEVLIYSDYPVPDSNERVLVWAR